MAEIRVASVDVLVLDPRRDHRLLLLQRAQDTRCPGSWEVVHGRIEPEERPEDAALREVREETGLVAERLYSVTCQSFYLHHAGLVNLAVVFAAFADSTEPLSLGAEHSAAAWLLPGVAEERLTWPRTRQSLRDVMVLLSTGDAGSVEDVLRVR